MTERTMPHAVVHVSAQKQSDQEANTQALEESKDAQCCHACTAVKPNHIRKHETTGTSNKRSSSRHSSQHSSQPIAPCLDPYLNEPAAESAANTTVLASQGNLSGSGASISECMRSSTWSGTLSWPGLVAFLCCARANGQLMYS